MAKVAILTAAGLVKTGNGILWAINVTKVATGAGAVTAYDNTTNSGGKMYDGDGLVQNSFQLNDGNGGGIPFSNGCYVDLGGTTKATVVVVYD